MMQKGAAERQKYFLRISKSNHNLLYYKKEELKRVIFTPLPGIII